MLETIRSWPKAELHLHLEGSIEPQTLLEIEPSLDLAEVEERLRFENFAGFLKSYISVNKLLTKPEHYAIATHRMLESLESQGVVYAEVNLSVGVVLWKEQDFAPIFDAITAAAEGHAVQVRWIFDGVRQFGPDHVQRVAELAVAYRDRGVVALGIGGDEVNGPASWFVEIFRWARSNGLHAVPHAGETSGPASVWGALELGARRIGHGIRSIEDPVLVRHLRDQRIPLEVSVTSNVLTGAVPSLAAHPVRKLYDAGVPIVLNTDDPALFRTNLLNEYMVAVNEFGFSLDQLRDLANLSLDSALDFNVSAQPSKSS
jgi:adenosine deaminase/aminodeoxyfutalosine deaminase